MTNKYLEKVARDMHWGHGIHFDGNRYYVPGEDDRKRFAVEYDKRNQTHALKTIPAGLAGTGAILAAVAAGKNWIKNPARTAKMVAGTAAGAGALGLAAAPFLARAGNNQMTESQKVTSRMHDYLRRDA